MSEFVGATKTYVLEELAKVSAGEYYEQDVEKLRNDDWFTLRFIQEKQAEKSKNLIKDAGDAVINCMKFRKSYEIYKIMEGNVFPVELLTNGPYQIDETNNCFYARVKKIKCSKDLMEMYKKYMIFTYETFDQLQVGSKRGNATVISDLGGSGLENFDLTISAFFVDLFVKYYPGIMQKLMLVDCVWYLKPPVSMITALMPDRISKKIMKLNQADAIRELGGPEKAADFMGGIHHFIMRSPPNPVTAVEFVKLEGVPEKSVEKLMCYVGK